LTLKKLIKDLSQSLYKKMPNSPERGQFLHQALEWTVPSSVSSKLNHCAAETLIAGDLKLFRELLWYSSL
jgi:hypothetical protein